MPSIPSRRPRPIEDEDDGEEDDIRLGTPLSSAPNDSKRTRPSGVCTGASRFPHNEDSQDEPPRLSRSEKGKVKIELNGDGPEESKYQPGAILRVKLTNFVTYTSAEFFPGPNLNMVIGPNGTGKSTLVCAICLGLGWGTQNLGRAKDVSEFVKHGCREATIEIELQRQTRGKMKTPRNPIITRLIKREGNKSSYLLNGSQVTGKAVMELARSFSIQIDNLCQFLPQDRVVEFAAMSPIELLQSTQAAAASREMLEWHENLKTLRSTQQEMMNKNHGNKEQLANWEKRQEMQKGDVERMKQRAEIQKRLGWLEKCRPLPKYEQANILSKQARARQKVLAEELKELKQELAPALRRVNAKQQYEGQVRALKEQRKRDVEEAEKKAEKIDKRIDDIDDKLTELDNMHRAEVRAAQKQKEDKRRIEQTIIRLEGQMEKEPEHFDPRAVNQEIQLKVERQRLLDDKVRELHDQGTITKAQGVEKKNAVEAACQQLADLKTQSGQQESKLQKISYDAYRAWKWIKENQDKFEHHVYGPPMVECSLKDPKYADSIETLFQVNDFTAITCQSKRDFFLLQKKLITEMRLHLVSLRVCSVDKLDQFRPPISDVDLRTFGLEGWAINYIQGPPTVLAMLCMEKFLHQTAVSGRDITDDQLDRIRDSPISGCIAGKTSYRFTRRREYGSAGVSTATRQLRSAQIWNDSGISTGAEAALQREINENSSDLDEIKIELQNIKTKIDEARKKSEDITEEIDALKKDKEQRQRALMAFKALPAKLAQEKEKQGVVDENLAGIRERVRDIDTERRQVILFKAEITMQYAAQISELRDLHMGLVEAEVMHIEAASDFETLKDRNEGVNNLLLQKQKEEQEAGDTAKEAGDAARKLVAELRQLSAEGRELEANGDSVLIDMLQDFGKRKISSEDLEAEIGSATARLELTHGGSEGIIREFEVRARDIEKLRERMRDFEQEQREHRNAIAEIRGNWEPRLDALVAKISDAFSDSFNRIGCAGQVTVYKASSNPDDQSEPHRTEAHDDSAAGGDGDGLDFANWAIHISVKFREAEPLSLLDSHRQSGGERAVSTIFYLMALQSLSRAPFRVVDEINQGMDPRNERMVHGRMVDIACGNEDERGVGSQYFLITPKLLSGLKYRKGMRVLCIVSGENMPKTEEGQPSKVDLGRWVAKAKELGLRNKTYGGERRADSGVPFSSGFDRSGVGDGDRRSQTAEVGA